MAQLHMLSTSNLLRTAPVSNRSSSPQAHHCHIQLEATHHAYTLSKVTHGPPSYPQMSQAFSYLCDEVLVPHPSWWLHASRMRVNCSKLLWKSLELETENLHTTSTKVPAWVIVSSVVGINFMLGLLNVLLMTQGLGQPSRWQVLSVRCSQVHPWAPGSPSDFHKDLPSAHR
jgi:hypothetical protein